jgi:glutamate formiminotransferase
MRGLIECVPNFSEGRDPMIIAELAGSIRQTSGVRLLDHSADADHHRSVFTFAGTPEGVLSAALEAAGIAVERIDLTGHSGVHPRIGAVDVVPFVPLSGAAMADSVELSRGFAETLWEKWRVPVFLYERAAMQAEHQRLEQVRQLAFADGAPDIGEGRHPTAGACVVGAREFLVAWNIWLETSDLALAKRIARAVRFSSGGFPGVKALGLPLHSLGLVQVAINSTDFRATPLGSVFQQVESLAQEAGVKVRGSELIGMIPQEAADLSLPWLNLTPGRILETAMADVPN